jgi:hypothetical protein
LLDPNGINAGNTFALPSDPMLNAELCAPEKIYMGSDGLKFRITPKTRTSSNFAGETLREKLGRSPDRADAVVYLSTVATGPQRRRLVVGCGGWNDAGSSSGTHGQKTLSGIGEYRGQGLARRLGNYFN